MNIKVISRNTAVIAALATSLAVSGSVGWPGVALFGALVMWEILDAWLESASRKMGQDKTLAEGLKTDHERVKLDLIRLTADHEELRNKVDILQRNAGVKK